MADSKTRTALAFPFPADLCGADGCSGSLFRLNVRPPIEYDVATGRMYAEWTCTCCGTAKQVVVEPSALVQRGIDGREYRQEVVRERSGESCPMRSPFLPPEELPELEHDDRHTLRADVDAEIAAMEATTPDLLESLPDLDAAALDVDPLPDLVIDDDGPAPTEAPAPSHPRRRD